MNWSFASDLFFFFLKKGSLLGLGRVFPLSTFYIMLLGKLCVSVDKGVCAKTFDYEYESVRLEISFVT